MQGDQFPDTQSFEPLSQREREILALLAENLSNREIADRLVIAYTTVKWYNQQIFNKLGVENRQQAVQRALEVGLLAPTMPQASAHTLPAQITPFISRVGELEDLNRLLIQSNTRFVTILAPGGMGKTRLALAIAEIVRRQFAEGVYFVSLAPLTSPDQLVPAIAECLGLQFAAERRTPKQQLLDFLHAKNALLVLDNFEHWLEGASLVTDLLYAAPSVKVIVTSRQRLDLDGETVYRLGGMLYPEDTRSENAPDYGAVQLFLECAHRAYPHFVDYDMGSIVRVCQLVEGMPLAIELAAAWVGALTPAEVADEITRSTDFLRTSMHNVPERLRSIRAVFEATWQRLTADEQQVFRRLSVFHRGCTREAAQVVAGAELGILAALLDKALLWHHPEHRRYEIHELLRQYAAEQLEAAGEAENVQNAYRDYFGHFAQAWGTALKTPKQLLALEMLEADFDNIRKTFQAAIETGRPEIVEPFTDLWYFYEIRARYLEAMPIFANAIEKLEGQDSLALGKLLAGQGLFHSRYYQWEPTRGCAEKSIEMLRRLGAAHETLMPMKVLASSLGNLGDPDGEVAIYREGVALAQQSHDPWSESLFTYLLGNFAAYRSRRFDEARHYLSQANILLTRLGNWWGLGFSLRDLAVVAYETGEYAEAKRLFEEGIASAAKVHHLINVRNGLEGLCDVALAQGDFLQAKHYAEGALEIARDLGNRVKLFGVTVQLARVAVTSGSLQEARERLHELIMLCADLEDSDCVIEFGLVAASYLAKIEARAEAVQLMGFLEPHLQSYFVLKLDRETMQILITQLQAELSADAYTAAWQQGQSLSSNEVLTKLHGVI